MATITLEDLAKQSIEKAKVACAKGVVVCDSADTIDARIQEVLCKADNPSAIEAIVACACLARIGIADAKHMNTVALALALSHYIIVIDRVVYMAGADNIYMRCADGIDTEMLARGISAYFGVTGESASEIASFIVQASPNTNYEAADISPASAGELGIDLSEWVAEMDKANNISGHTAAEVFDSYTKSARALKSGRGRMTKHDLISAIEALGYTRGRDNIFTKKKAGDVAPPSASAISALNKLSIDADAVRKIDERCRVKYAALDVSAYGAKIAAELGLEGIADDVLYALGYGARSCK